MTREQAKSLLPVIQAFADGKPVQFHPIANGSWYDTEDPTFAGHLEWRIKPEPRKAWVNEYADGFSDGTAGVIYLTREKANVCARSGRIACHEIELPPLP